MLFYGNINKFDRLNILDMFLNQMRIVEESVGGMYSLEFKWFIYTPICRFTIFGNVHIARKTLPMFL